jgi:hypothetical protein
MRLPKINQSNKWRSKRSEKRAARIHNGRVQPASGALPVARFKGDVVSDQFLIDDKTTNSKSFAVNSATFIKLRREAFINRKSPMIRVEFPNITVCVIEEKLLAKLMNQ